MARADGSEGRPSREARVQSALRILMGLPLTQTMLASSSSSSASMASSSALGWIGWMSGGVGQPARCRRSDGDPLPDEESGMGLGATILADAGSLPKRMAADDARRVADGDSSNGSSTGSNGAPCPGLGTGAGSGRAGTTSSHSSESSSESDESCCAKMLGEPASVRLMPGGASTCMALCMRRAVGDPGSTVESRRFRLLMFNPLVSRNPKNSLDAKRPGLVLECLDPCCQKGWGAKGRAPY